MMPSWDEMQGGTQMPGLSQCPGPAAGQARQVANVEPRVSRRKLTASTRLTGYQREVNSVASYNVCTCYAAFRSRPHTDWVPYTGAKHAGSPGTAAQLSERQPGC